MLLNASFRGATFGFAFILSSLALSAPVAAVSTPSWNGYRWARTGVLTLKTVNRTTSAWSNYLTPALSGWSKASQIDMVVSRGTVNSTCNPVYATIQVCNGSYGTNGWLGYANVWTSGGFITQATVRMNDSYFLTDKYNKFAWRTSVLCQELGHTLGLDHNNTVRGDSNTGSCMDYTNDPDGGTTYGKTNIAAGSMDFAGLDIIYKQLDSSQLSGTRPLMTGEGLYIAGFGHHGGGAVPEPASWAMLIAGFGMTGFAARRRRVASPA